MNVKPKGAQRIPYSTLLAFSLCLSHSLVFAQDASDTMDLSEAATAMAGASIEKNTGVPKLCYVKNKSGFEKPIDCTPFDPNIFNQVKSYQLGSANTLGAIKTKVSGACMFYNGSWARGDILNIENKTTGESKLYFNFVNPCEKILVVSEDSKSGSRIILSPKIQDSYTPLSDGTYVVKKDGQKFTSTVTDFWEDKRIYTTCYTKVTPKGISVGGKPCGNRFAEPGFCTVVNFVETLPDLPSIYIQKGNTLFGKWFVRYNNSHGRAPEICRGGMETLDMDKFTSANPDKTIYKLNYLKLATVVNFGFNGGTNALLDAMKIATDNKAATNFLFSIFSYKKDSMHFSLVNSCSSNKIVTTVQQVYNSFATDCLIYVGESGVKIFNKVVNKGDVIYVKNSGPSQSKHIIVNRSADAKGHSLLYVVANSAFKASKGKTESVDAWEAGNALSLNSVSEEQNTDETTELPLEPTKKNITEIADDSDWAKAYLKILNGIISCQTSSAPIKKTLCSNPSNVEDAFGGKKGSCLYINGNWTLVSKPQKASYNTGSTNNTTQASGKTCTQVEVDKNAMGSETYASLEGSGAPTNSDLKGQLSSLRKIKACVLDEDKHIIVQCKNEDDLYFDGDPDSSDDNESTINAKSCAYISDVKLKKNGGTSNSRYTGWVYFTKESMKIEGSNRRLTINDNIIHDQPNGTPVRYGMVTGMPCVRIIYEK